MEDAFCVSKANSMGANKDRKARSGDAPYYGATEALANPVCVGRQKARQETRPNRQRGQGPECVCQGHNQRDNQRVQPQHARNEQL
eukprot:3238800-Ditylum_brightwellii.AAC.1